MPPTSGQVKQPANGVARSPWMRMSKSERMNSGISWEFKTGQADKRLLWPLVGTLEQLHRPAPQTPEQAQHNHDDQQCNQQRKHAGLKTPATKHNQYITWILRQLERHKHTRCNHNQAEYQEFFHCSTSTGAARVSSGSISGFCSCSISTRLPDRSGRRGTIRCALSCCTSVSNCRACSLSCTK